MPYGEALKKYGDNLRVAPLAVVEEADKSHISHDSSYCQDQETSPRPLPPTEGETPRFGTALPNHLVCRGGLGV